MQQRSVQRLVLTRSSVDFIKSAPVVPSSPLIDAGEDAAHNRRRQDRLYFDLDQDYHLSTKEYSKADRCRQEPQSRPRVFSTKQS